MIKIAFLSDPLSSFNIQKDSTYMMMQAAAHQGWDLYHISMNQLYVENGVAYANARHFNFIFDSLDWHQYTREMAMPLSEFDVILMRKDPPFDMEYIYATYMLDLAEQCGVLVVNKPQALRDYNEKVAVTRFPQFAPNTLITRSQGLINQFLEQYQDIIVKPLDGMGGSSIFRIKKGDSNKNVIIETLTQHQSVYAMIQEFEPDIVYGDKRILIVDGQPVDYLMARVPNQEDGRGNLAAGATAVVRQLEDYEYAIAREVGAFLKANGVLFAGLDVIGKCLTEINITSPTGIQEVYKQSGINAAELLIESIAKKLAERE